MGETSRQAWDGCGHVLTPRLGHRGHERVSFSRGALQQSYRLASFTLPTLFLCVRLGGRHSLWQKLGELVEKVGVVLEELRHLGIHLVD